MPHRKPGQQGSGNSARHLPAARPWLLEATDLATLYPKGPAEGCDRHPYNEVEIQNPLAQKHKPHRQPLLLLTPQLVAQELIPELGPGVKLSPSPTTQEPERITQPS